MFLPCHELRWSLQILNCFQMPFLPESLLELTQTISRRMNYILKISENEAMQRSIYSGKFNSVAFSPVIIGTFFAGLQKLILTETKWSRDLIKLLFSRTLIWWQSICQGRSTTDTNHIIAAACRTRNSNWTVISRWQLAQNCTQRTDSGSSKTRVLFFLPSVTHVSWNKTFASFVQKRLNSTDARFRNSS